MKIKYAIALLVTTSGCAPEYRDDPVYNYSEPEAQPVANEAQVVAEKAETERLSAIESARRSNPELNWIRIGISTGKFSESIGSQVYKTWDECEAAYLSEANTCAPIGALPDSYWDHDHE